MLDELLSALPEQAGDPALLLGTENGDDAAVYKINDDQAVISTTDFFMPIVDDPFDFGRIAAANALSDVWATGGKPILAIAIAGMPVDKLSPAHIQAILAGGTAMCQEAGVPIAGGHTIDAPEPIYGLAVTGLVHPDKIMRNDRARSGDMVILGKPLGVGVLGAAMNKGGLDEMGYADLLRTTTRLNAIGADLAGISGVHAVTDVTGFGLLGHLLEMCRGAGLSGTIDMASVPLLESAAGYAKRGFKTGAATRNWASYGDSISRPDTLADWQLDVLCDPQTSGGLLVACAERDAPRVVDQFLAQGHEGAAVIGSLATGDVRIDVV